MSPSGPSNLQSRSPRALHRASSSSPPPDRPPPSSDNSCAPHRRPMSPIRSPSAKRSPSILVTDARKGQVKAPFAGHRLKQIQSTQHPERYSQPVRKGNPLNLVKGHGSSTKYSNITVSNLTSNISDIPSSRRREAPRYMSASSVYSRGPSGVRPIPQFMRALPSRSSRSIERLVLIPDEATLAETHPETGEATLGREAKSEATTDNIFLTGYKRTRAESMSKERRELEYPRVTAYLIAEGFNLKLTAKFLAKHHLVSPRLYDDMLYVSYSLPLLPGDNGYRVKSNNSAKNERGNELMKQFIDKSELREHHYEFYSGEEVENSSSRKYSGSDTEPGGALNSDFDPSEPQFFISGSPTESIMDEGLNPIPENSVVDGGNGFSEKSVDDSQPVSFTAESAIDDNLDIAASNSFRKRRRHSELPDLSKHAEMFILNYGVVVFWNFSEIHEKNILADIVFAKIEPGEFEDDDDDDDDDEDEEEEEADDEEEGSNDKKSLPADGSDDNSEDEDEDQSIQLIIKPVPEQDIEMEDFHFEYNKEVPTPRIFNDMITLKSGDHLIKLTISHAIAQSTKLSMFESKMSIILNSISKLPKLLALTGRLQNYTTKKLLMKTGRLLQLRGEVNLSSSVLDTPEYFWSIEPGLHPLYVAIREYLEIEQRVEVLNDRGRVFLDFFDIVSDSLAENKMVKITKILILAIGLSVIVSVIEIVIRYFLIRRI
ncbi:DEKNAAC102162 [Brettanomyces naardenensis]|uniref:DEKNAAC102162 n=1 Tax=Brettanomyces naardenensis TaxID=13370 RepID=A0A448YK17_BRENA|nr:DEKNAAC102162 [Brettanomyces naardenensis]